MFHTAIGHAEGIDTAAVVARALGQLSENLGGDAPAALLVFASSEFDHAAMLQAITAAYPGVPLAGGTTMGEVSSTLGLSDDSILVTALVSDTITFASGIARDLALNPASVAEAAWGNAASALKEPPRLCLAFPESHSDAVGQAMHRLADIAQENGRCTLAGGILGTGPSSQRTPVQFHESGPLSGGLVVLMAAGPITAYTLACQNWHEIGRTGTVTDTDGPVIRSIDGRPAAEYYRELLGRQAPPLPEFPLSVSEKGSGRSLIRGVLAIDETSGAIRVSDDVARGATVRLAKAKPQNLLEGVHEQFKGIPREVAERSALALAFSCGARRWLLGTSAGKELKTVACALPCHLPLAGFYSYGEIGPLERGGPSFLHNHTLIAVLLGEENAAPLCRPSPGKKPGRRGEGLSLEGLRNENEFLGRKLARSEFNLENMEKHRTAWLALMMNLQAGLRKSEERYRRVVESCSEGFLLQGTDHCIEYVNDAWLALTGYTREEVLGTCPSAYASDSEYKWKDQSGEVIGPWRRETSLVHKNGRHIPVLINSNVLTSDSGELMGYFSFTTDLTEQKKALLLAGQFQQSLFPSEAPAIPGLDLAGRSEPCDEVGGDYFDYISHAQGPCALVVADVSGHGVDASLLMSSVRTYLRSHPTNKETLGDTVSNLNAQLAQDVLQTGRFVTLFHLLADSASGDLVWVRAGHDPAWVYDPDTDDFSLLAGEGLPLGIFEDTRYTANVLRRRPRNAIIILGTDGIWESRNVQGEMFGKERFLNIIRQNAKEDARTIRDRVFEAVREFSRGVRSDDDMTLVVARFHGED